MKRSATTLISLILLTQACNIIKPSQTPVLDPIPTETRSPDIQIGTTNSSGAVIFTEVVTGEEVPITVIDTKGSRLQGMTVFYEHGVTNRYEAFFVKDPLDRLVAVGFFSHNSDHEIVVEPNVMHRANPDQEQALAGYVNEMGARSQDFYKGTLTCEEYEEVINRAEMVLHIEVDLLLVFFGIHVPPTGELVYDSGKEPCKGQWDWYESYSPAYYGTESVYISSQPPVMEAVEVEQFAAGVVHMSWLATDSQEYSGWRSYKIDLLDHTIFLGPTAFSDITYHYRLVNNIGSPQTDWVETRLTDVEIPELKVGTYRLEVFATDEVNNHSEIMQRVFDVAAAGGVAPSYGFTLTPKEIWLRGIASTPSRNGSGFGVDECSVLAVGTEFQGCVYQGTLANGAFIQGFDDGCLGQWLVESITGENDVFIGDEVEIFGEVTGMTAHGCGLYISICGSSKYFLKR